MLFSSTHQRQKHNLNNNELFKVMVKQLKELTQKDFGTDFVENLSRSYHTT